MSTFLSKPALIALPAAFLMTVLALVAIYPSHAPVSAPAAPVHRLNDLTVTDLPEIVVTPDASSS